MNFPRAFILGSAALVVLSACSKDDTKTTTTTPYTTTSTTTTTTTAAGGGGTGGAGGGVCTFDPGAGGFGGFGDVCTTEPSDTECVVCTRANCCNDLGPCTGDPTCSCLLQCFLDGCDPVGCLTTCGSSTATNALITCATVNCQQLCVGP